MINIGAKKTNTKSFIFGDAKYQFDFDSFARVTKYAQQLESDFQSDEIPLLSQCDKIDLTPEGINCFVATINDKGYKPEPSTIFQVYFLSVKYGISELTDGLSNFITSNLPQDQKLDFLISLLDFKSKLISTYKDNQGEPYISELLNFANNLASEETLFSQNLQTYIANHSDNLLKLGVPSLFRIFHKYFKEGNKTMDKNILIPFLFQCLDRDGKSASILFQFITINPVDDIETINKLLNEPYSKKFNFNYLNQIAYEAMQMFASNQAETYLHLQSQISDLIAANTKLVELLLLETNPENQQPLQKDLEAIIKKLNKNT